jgi:hypothetical protein
MTRCPPDPVDGQLDPVFRHGRREFWCILLTWGVCLIWCVSYCWHQGYCVPTEAVPVTLGIPRWVFGGILVPWLLATIFSIAFGLFWMVDEPLGEEEHEEDDEDDR